MKSLLYLLLLLAVLVASVVLLRSIEGGDRPEPPRPVAESAVSRIDDLDAGRLSELSPDELYREAVKLLNLWHVREATALFERTVEADSSHFDAFVRLVECYSHPLVGREDEAGTAARSAAIHRRSDADTVFLAGLKSMYIDRDFATAAALLSRVQESDIDDNARYQGALAFLKSGKPDEARRVLEHLSAGEAAQRAKELSIRCAVVENDFESAREQAKELARKLADEPYPYVLLAMVELLNGNEQAAVEFCNNALVLDSRCIPAIVARGNLYAASGEYEAARVSFEKLLLFDDPILRALAMDGIGFVEFMTARFEDGAAAMDEAIRFAMLAGSVRQGLTYSANLIGYLCELGQLNKAEEVVDRWVSGFGDIPMELATLRIRELAGDRETAQKTIMAMQSKKEWAIWMGMMSIDFDEMNARLRIGEKQYQEALGVLSKSAGTGSTEPGVRAFLKGYASFQSGDAETAAAGFGLATRRLYGVEFPYRGNPVLYVQSFFYLAEVGIAAGKEGDAAAQYRRFLDFWGDADWEVQAVSRAQEKLATISTSPQ